MADQDPRSPESIFRQPLQPSESSSQPQDYGQEEYMENIVHLKPLTTTPIPIHEAPLSPVKISVQSDEWPLQASSAQIGEGNFSIRQVKDVKTPQQGQYQAHGSSEEVIVHDMPHRQNYTTHAGELLQQPQVAILSSVQSANSTLPHSEPSQGDEDQSQQPQVAILSSVQSANSTLPHSEPSHGDEDQSQQPQVAILSSLQSANSMLPHSEPSHGDEDQSIDTSSFESDISDASTAIPAVQPLQYHHQQHYSNSSDTLASVAEAGADINRHLTPISLHGHRSAIPRPASTYSAFSDADPRGHSPGHNPQSPSWAGRSPSSNLGGRSPDTRPSSYVDLLNVPYPQPAPIPISFDNSQLRTAVGSNASLLSTAKTLEMYRLNVKKTNDPSIQYAFAIFLIAAAQEAGLNESGSPSGKLGPANTARDLDSPYIESLSTPSSPQDLLREARQILSRLSDRSYPFAQYYLADGYASGLFNKGKEDYDRAFPLFVAASKHGHAESGYRAALCYEFGWGCRKDPAKAVQFYRQSASKNHPGAMTRLGRACLSGDLGMNKYREGIKWLKRSTDAADPQYNAAPYHLGLLYETGYGDDIFQDETYAAQLFTRAADLGHAEASYRLGDAYEHGKLSCPRDPALSVHFYTGAAQQNHPAAMMALCAWYMVGAEPVLEKDENEAYEWAHRAAECGLTKAEYAVGYFTEMGIGCQRDPLEANVWYVRAADAGDERAKHRLAAIRAAASGENLTDAGNPKNKKKGAAGKADGKTKAGADGGGGSPKDEKECIVM